MPSKCITNYDFICTGCGACVVACPKQCIVLKKDRFMQLKPLVHRRNCVGCEVCVKKCPQITDVIYNHPKKCFAAWSKDREVLYYSSSGGVAYEISKYGINNGYVVYGCDYNSDGRLSFFRVRDKNDLFKIQSSKYSFSELYMSLKDIISHDDKVIFIGMPCQVAAVKSLSGKNVILVDIICHGMPPTDYLIQHLKNTIFDKITFRGEYNNHITVWNNQKIVYQKNREKDEYYRSFYSNIISNDACYVCKYAQRQRVSDMTIGDYWGLGKMKNAFERYSRPSIVLCNSDSGLSLFHNIEHSLHYEERNVEEGVKGNGRLNNAPGHSVKHSFYKFFYLFLGFDTSVKLVFLAEKVAKTKLLNHFKHLLKNKK